MSNNPPEVLVGMDRATAEFILLNCDANIAMGLAHLQSVSREGAEKLVDQIEKFKKLRDFTKKALKDA